MTWSAPAVYVAGNVLTAAQMNAISADLNETAAAKATSVGSFFIGAGSNSLNERQFSSSRVNTAETYTSNFYGECTTTQLLTLTTSTLALVIVTARLSNSTVDADSFATFNVTGASTVNADDNLALLVRSSTAGGRVRASAVTVMTSGLGLVAGSNNFRMVFKCTSATMTAASRDLLILPL